MHDRRRFRSTSVYIWAAFRLWVRGRNTAIAGTTLFLLAACFWSWWELFCSIESDRGRDHIALLIFLTSGTSPLLPIDWHPLVSTVLPCLSCALWPINCRRWNRLELISPLDVIMMQGVMSFVINARAYRNLHRYGRIGACVHDLQRTSWCGS